MLFALQPLRFISFLGLPACAAGAECSGGAAQMPKQQRQPNSLLARSELWRTATPAPAAVAYQNELALAC